MSVLFCRAQCLFQADGRCRYLYATPCGMPSCRSNACVHFTPRAAALTHAPAAAAHPRPTAPQGASNRPDAPTDFHVALE